MEWKPATIDEVKGIAQSDLETCNQQQISVFEKYAVEPYFVAIVRKGKVELVVVVARNGTQVIYWEDVEEGFNVSELSSDDSIIEWGANQGDLGLALRAWMNT